MDTTASRPSASTSSARSLISLFSDLWRETSALVHDEVALARAEVSEKVDRIGSGIAFIAAAALILFAGFLMVLLAAANALALVLPPDSGPWLAPFLVGVAVLIIGFIALAKGRSDLKARNLTPERTLESLRQDRELVREHAS